jgi:hypothetical protein
MAIDASDLKGTFDLSNGKMDGNNTRIYSNSMKQITQQLLQSMKYDANVKTIE